MIFQSKQKVNGAPIWEVDTDTQTVRHRNPKTGETERYVFHAARDADIALTATVITQEAAVYKKI